jgi:hypothetical protein
MPSTTIHVPDFFSLFDIKKFKYKNSSQIKYKRLQQQQKKAKIFETRFK